MTKDPNCRDGRQVVARAACSALMGPEKSLAGPFGQVGTLMKDPKCRAGRHTVPSIRGQVNKKNTVISLTVFFLFTWFVSS